MGVFLLLMAIGAICILLLKMIFRQFKIRSLYLSFLNHEKSLEYEITGEYLEKYSKDIDKTIANDLELGKVFKIINRTNSMVGREYMYAQMFISQHNHEQLENMISKLKDENKLKKILYELYNLTTGYNQSLDFFEFQNSLTKIDMIIVFLANIILFGLIGSCFFYVENVAILILWVMIENLIYTHFMKKTDDMMMRSIGYCYVVECLKQLVKLDIYSKEDTQSIQQMVRKASQYTFIYRMIRKVSQIDIFYLMEFIKGMFFVPIYQTYFLLKNKSILAEDYKVMYKYVGMVDMAISIISLRDEYQTCIPTQVNEPCIRFEECYHPLISYPVKNSFDTNESCIITGSNASGKSTFLKTVGVNMIMARAFHTCFADEFDYYPFQLCTSIHIQDDLVAGESYYIREIKTLKMILDDIKNKKCLVLIDEILRGTNERERLAISKVILEYMFQSQSLIFVTTHDLSLVEYFKDVHKFCFNDEVVGKSWTSDYKIKEGICTVGNAIKLLDIYGYDKEICEQLKKPD